MVQPFIPNSADAAITEQAEPDSEDFEYLAAATALTGVVSGCVLSEDPVTADMTVDVTAGKVRIAGRPVTVSAQANNTITAADGTNTRIDLISINLSGTVVVTAGTPAAEPVAPSLPADSCQLGLVYVPATDTAITDAQIVAKRTLVPDNDGVFNVAWYGATADGTNESTEIQAAATAAAANGGTVYFPYIGTGVYGIQTTITADVDVSFILEQGVVIDNTLTTSVGAAFAITGAGTTDTGKTRGRFQGGRISAGATGNRGLDLIDAYGYSVYDTKISCSDLATHGVRVIYSAAGSAYCDLVNVHVFEALTIGILIDGGGASWSNRQQMRGCWVEGSVTGVQFSNCDTIWAQVDTENCTTGLDLDDSRLCTVFHISESDTTALDLGSGDGHRLFGSWGTVDAATATNVLMIGGWDESAIVNGPLDGNGHTLIQLGLLETPRMSTPRVLETTMKEAERVFASGSWPATASDAIGYVDFGDQDIIGNIEISIEGGYFVSPAWGVVRKEFSFWHAVDATSITTLSGDVTAAYGPIVDLFSIGDPEIHTTDNVRVPIYRLNDSETGDIVIRVRVRQRGSDLNAYTILDNVTITAPALSAHAAVANVVTANDGDRAHAGNVLYDSDGAKRIEMLAGGDINLYDEDGVTIVFYWDETAGAVIVNNVDLQIAGAADLDLSNGGNVKNVLGWVGKTSTTARIDFTSGHVVTYDNGNAKRIEVLAGGDIIFYDEDGTTARLTYDETGPSWDFGADIDLVDNDITGITTLEFTDTATTWDHLRITQTVDAVNFLMVDQSGTPAYAWLQVRGPNEASQPGDIYLDSPSDGATILQWDESDDRLELSKSIDMQGNTIRDVNRAVEYASSPTLDWDDHIVSINSSAATRAVTLPSCATYNGHAFFIQRDGTNSVTIDPGTDTFSDTGTSTDKTLGSDGASIGLYSIGGTEWKVAGTSGTVT